MSLAVAETETRHSTGTHFRTHTDTEVITALVRFDNELVQNVTSLWTRRVTLPFTDAFLYLRIAVGVRAVVRLTTDSKSLRRAQRHILGRQSGSTCASCAIALRAAAGHAVW